MKWPSFRPWPGADVAFLRDVPLELAPLVDAVAHPSRGGIATFVGTVRHEHQGRKVTRLSYSAYAAMVEDEAARLLDEAGERFGAAVAAVHRVGTLEVGEPAVMVAAAAPHRDAAFAAARWTIDEIKRRLPIWKQEQYDDGRMAWVDPTAPGGLMPSPAREAT